MEEVSVIMTVTRRREDSRGGEEGSGQRERAVITDL